MDRQIDKRIDRQIDGQIDRKAFSCGCTLKSMKQTCPYGELFSEQVNRQMDKWIDVGTWIDKKSLFLRLYNKVYETDIPLLGIIFRIGEYLDRQINGQIDSRYGGTQIDRKYCSFGFTLKSMKQTCPYGELFSEQVNIQMDRWIDTQIERWIDRQMDRQI